MRPNKHHSRNTKRRNGGSKRQTNNSKKFLRKSMRMQKGGSMNPTFWGIVKNAVIPFGLWLALKSVQKSDGKTTPTASASSSTTLKRTNSSKPTINKRKSSSGGNSVPHQTSSTKNRTFKKTQNLKI